VESVDVVQTNNDRITVRVDDAFLKIDANHERIEREAEAMNLVPVPTPSVLWCKPPALALRALRGRPLGHLGKPSTAGPAAWAAAGAVIRTLHDAPLPPWPGKSVDELRAVLVRESDWLIVNEVLPADVIERNRSMAEEVLRTWTPVFTHGDLHIEHVFSDGDAITGIIDWSEAGPGDAMFDLASLTLGQDANVADVIAGYGPGVDRRAIASWQSWRCLKAIRWLSENGYGDPKDLPETAILRSLASRGR